MTTEITNKFRLTRLLFVASLMSLVCSTSFAAPGHGSEGGGGGHTVGGELYDLYLQTSGDRVDLAKLPLYKEAVQPTLDRLMFIMPDFIPDLTASVNGKRWVFTKNALVCPVVHPVLKINAQPVACQDQFTIWIDAKKFSALPMKTRGAVLIHEMMRAIVIQKDLTEEGLYLATASILTELNEFQLQADLSTTGFGDYQVGMYSRALADAKYFYDEKIKQSLGYIYTRFCNAQLPALEAQQLITQAISDFEQRDDKITSAMLRSDCYHQGEQTYPIVRDVKCVAAVSVFEGIRTEFKPQSVLGREYPNYYNTFLNVSAALSLADKTNQIPAFCADWKEKVFFKQNWGTK